LVGFGGGSDGLGFGGSDGLGFGGGSDGLGLGFGLGRGGHRGVGIVRPTATRFALFRWKCDLRLVRVKLALP
jgi:hypothetical protein